MESGGARAHEHEKIQARVGEWAVQCTFHTPMGEIPCEGTEVCEAFGPYWTVSRTRVLMPGMPKGYEGLAQVGWDPAREVVVGTWIDTLNPRLTLLEGGWNDAGTALEMRGEGLHPLTHQNCELRTLEEESEDGTRSFRMWLDEVLALEYRYTRAD